MATKTAPKLESSPTPAEPSPTVASPAEEGKPTSGPAQDSAAVETFQPAPVPAAPVPPLSQAYTESLERKLREAYERPGGPGPTLAIQGSAHTEQLGQLMGALAQAQGSLRGALKDAANPHLRNKYADLGSVWDAWQEVGPRCKLGMSQVSEANAQTVTVTTILGHSSGQWIRSALTLPWQAQKGITDAQAIGSALTYARRYGLAALVGVCPEDDDGNGAGRPGGGEQVAVQRYESNGKNGGNGNGGKHPAAERREAKMATAGADQGVTPEDLRRLKSDVWKLVCQFCDIRNEDGTFDEAGTKIEAGVRLQEFKLIPINPESNLADLALANPSQLAQLKAKLQAALIDSPEKLPGDPF